MSPRLLAPLKPERYTDYHMWMTALWATHHTDPGLLEEFKAFSSSAPPSMTRRRLEEEWGRAGRMRGGGYGIGTLRQWAEKDDPVGYQAWRDKVERLDRLTALVEAPEEASPRPLEMPSSMGPQG